MPKLKILFFVSMVCVFLRPECHANGTDMGVVWATNVGGPAYMGLDGISYSAEESVSGGEIKSLDDILGSQDPFIYQTYREGDIKVDRDIENGQYTAIFHFSEPQEIGQAEREFDILIEEKRVVTGLDVMLFRDGKIKSALTVAVPNIEITDGAINISLAGKTRSPVLSALVIRRIEPRDSGWELVWSDEFDRGSTPDPARWSIDEWPARTVNDEDQAYTARPENLRVEDGMLVIEAHKESYGDAEYTSGRIHSGGKGDLLYGRVEVRAKLPDGKGTWAAAWMLPSDPFKYATTCGTGDLWQGVDECDAWPNSGEIDIMEHVGYQPGHIHGTVHNKAFYWMTWQQRKGRIIFDNIADDFHDYSMEWTPGRIDIFVDDELYFTYINEGNGWLEWPYDQPFHVILNLAIGGGWGRAGGGIDDAQFPQKMLVDYVRVYRARD